MRFRDLPERPPDQVLRTGAIQLAGEPGIVASQNRLFPGFCLAIVGFSVSGPGGRAGPVPLLLKSVVACRFRPKTRGEILYASVKHLLDKLGGPAESIEFTREDTRTAVAVLYYRVILVDGRIRAQELQHFRDLLARTLDVSEDELMHFEQEVLRIAQEDSSLFPLTSLIRRLPVSRRREILEDMKAISLSDQEFHEFEINMVARAAELLGLDGKGEEDSGKAS